MADDEAPDDGKEVPFEGAAPDSEERGAEFRAAVAAGDPPWDGPPVEGNVSTGFEALDRGWGGFPPGSLVALVAAPDAPSEELLYPPATFAPARYLSLLRNAPEVERHAAATGYDTFDVTETDTAPLLDDPAGALSGLDPESVVVVDPATELEREGRERYLSFVSTLKRAVETTDSVAVLHCPRTNPRALQRDLTLARADAVLELERYSAEDPRLGVRWFCYCHKNRFGRVPDAPVHFDFTDGPRTVHAREL
jgi:hypothetical protein